METNQEKFDNLVNELIQVLKDQPYNTAESALKTALTMLKYNSIIVAIPTIKKVETEIVTDVPNRKDEADYFRNLFEKQKEVSLGIIATNPLKEIEQLQHSVVKLDQSLPKGCHVSFQFSVFGKEVPVGYHAAFRRTREQSNLPPPTLEDYQEELARQNLHIFGASSNSFDGILG
jgi:hypothetical protein